MMSPKSKAKLSPNRKARRASTPVKKPMLVVELATPKEPMRVSWLNGADPYAAPWHLRRAIEIVEAHLNGTPQD
jgi:hypothetical protein